MRGHIFLSSPLYILHQPKQTTEQIMHLSAAIPGSDPREPPGICTKTFANSTYPGPTFLHKNQLPLSLPGEHNLKGLPNCNIISCVIFNKSLTIIHTVSKHSQSTCFVHTARFSFIPCKSQNDNFHEHIHPSACVYYAGLHRNILTRFLPASKQEKVVTNTCFLLICRSQFRALSNYLQLKQTIFFL